MRFALYYVCFLILFLASCTTKTNFGSVNANTCDSADDKFDCIASFIIKEGNPNYCPILEKNQSECYMIASLRSKDINLCNKIVNADDVRLCKTVVSIDLKNIKNCEKYAFENTPENLANGKLVKLYCKFYVNKNSIKLKNGIILGHNIHQNAQECEAYALNTYIKDEITRMQLKEQCYFDIAVLTKSISYCDKVNKPRRYYCQARAS